MAQINRLSRGLLQLLDSQNQGVNPASLAEEIVPTLDLTRFIQLSKGLTNQGAQTTLIVGAQDLVTFVVPEGRIWWVVAGSVEVQAVPPYNGASEFNISSKYIIATQDMFIPMSNENNFYLTQINATSPVSKKAVSFLNQQQSVFPLIPGNAWRPRITYLDTTPVNTVTAFQNLWYYDLPY